MTLPVLPMTFRDGVCAALPSQHTSCAVLCLQAAFRQTGRTLQSTITPSECCLLWQQGNNQQKLSFLLQKNSTESKTSFPDSSVSRTHNHHNTSVFKPYFFPFETTMTHHTKTLQGESFSFDRSPQRYHLLKNNFAQRSSSKKK